MGKGATRKLYALVATLPHSAAHAAMCTLSTSSTRSLFAKGTAVSPEDVHNAWAAWMTHLGKHNDALVPFARLAPSTRAEDDPFVEAIRRVVTRRRAS